MERVTITIDQTGTLTVDEAGDLLTTAQTLSLDGSNLSISSGNTITLPAGVGSGVDSVNGESGIVVLDTDDIPEGATNKYMTSAQSTKLDGIEDNADVTDATNVEAAGALMDSELADLAGIKGLTVSTKQDVLAEGAFVDGDKTKLDGIEAGATADQDLSGYQLQPAEGAFVDGDKTKLDGIESGATGDQTASEVSYDNTTSGLVASNVNAAIDEVEARVDANDAKISYTDAATVSANTSKLAGIENNAKDDQSAAEVPFNNTTSGLTATDVQAALDEIEGRVDTNDAKISYTDGAAVSANTLKVSADGSVGTHSDVTIGAATGSVASTLRILADTNTDGTYTVTDWTPPTGGGGESNTTSNDGAGEGLAKAKDGVDLPFKSLVAGTNITLSSDADTVTINSSAGGGTVDVVSNVASGVILGRSTAGSGDSEELTPAEARTLLNVEDGATADQTGAEIKTAYEGEADTNAFTDAEKTKLSGIEANATADQTGAEIKTAYEAEADTNAFTDAEKTKLAGVESGATADQTGAEIKIAYEGEANTNAFTDTEKSKLSGIENNATADQSDAEIKTAYENNADTNAFTDAEQTKVGFIAVTQAVDLDTLESDVTTNNAKVSADGSIDTHSDITIGTAVGSTNATLRVLADTNTDGTYTVVDWTPPTGGGGEANTSSNLGAGEGLAAAKNGVDLPFKSLVGGTNISLTSDADTVTITNDINASQSYIIPLSDLTTDLTTGTTKGYFRAPYACTVTAVRASVLTAPTGSGITIDINENGVSILSTLLTIDDGEKTSTTAATAAVISDSALAADAEITFDVDAIGSTTAGAGLQVQIDIERV